MIEQRLKALEREARLWRVVALTLVLGSSVFWSCAPSDSNKRQSNAHAAPANDDGIIVARGLKIVDGNGKIRADILVDSFDEFPKEGRKDLSGVRLRLFGKEGELHATLQTIAGSDDRGKQHGFASLAVSTGDLKMADGVDGEKIVGADISVDDGRGWMGLRGPDLSMAAFTLAPSSTPQVTLMGQDKSGKRQAATLEPTELSLRDGPFDGSQKVASLGTQRFTLQEGGANRLVLGSADLQVKASGDQIKTAPTLTLFDKDGNVTWRAGR